MPTYARPITTDRPSSMLRKSYQPSKALAQQPHLVPDKDYFFAIHVPGVANDGTGIVSGVELQRLLENFAGDYRLLTDDSGKCLRGPFSIFFCPKELLPEQSFA